MNGINPVPIELSIKKNRINPIPIELSIKKANNYFQVISFN